MPDTNGAPAFVVTGVISAITGQAAPSVRIGAADGPASMHSLSEQVIDAASLPYSYEITVPATVGTLGSGNKHCFFATTAAFDPVTGDPVTGSPRPDFHITANIACTEIVKEGVKDQYQLSGSFPSTFVPATGGTAAHDVPGGKGTVHDSPTFVVQAESN